MVLVDTSIWVAHFKQTNPTLIHLLTTDTVLTHPMVIGELACGTPPEPRQQTLSDMALLQSVNHASLAEVRHVIETEQLFGLGCGLIDLILLASTLITPGARLWTLDKRLAKLAHRFDVHYSAN